jgi:hypothetical protein
VTIGPGEDESADSPGWAETVGDVVTRIPHRARATRTRLVGLLVLRSPITTPVFYCHPILNDARLEADGEDIGSPPGDLVDADRRRQKEALGKGSKMEE